MYRIIAVLLLAGLLPTARPASAQEIRSPYRFVDETQSVGLWGGTILTNPGELGIGPQSAPAAGLRYTIRISGPFAIEAGVGFIPTERRVLDVDTTVVDSLVHVEAGRADLSILTLDGALRFNFTGPRTVYRLMPYLLFGAGFAIDVAGSAAVDTELSSADVVYDFGTTFAGEVGGGIEWFATRRLTLRLDARDILWQIQAPEALLDDEGVLPKTEWVQNALLTATIAYRF